jgi:hypothetical protein
VAGVATAAATKLNAGIGLTLDLGGLSSVSALRLAIKVSGLIGAAAFAMWWAWAIVVGWENRFDVWLFDWNVYQAGARDLVARTVYEIPLVQPGHRLPVEDFNYPPLAATWAAPLLPLGREAGGIVWLVICGTCLAIGTVFSVRAAGLWLGIAGLSLAVYTRLPFFFGDVMLGNNNHLVFALIGVFVWAHLSSRQRLAGALLAMAIGTKVWPIALLVLLLRERRWTEMRWVLAGLTVQFAAFAVWQGLDGLEAMVGAVSGGNSARATEADVGVLWTTAARLMWDWWPAWGGYALAVLLLAIPATGKAGLGLGILAGLSLNQNLWNHYLLTFLLAVVLLLVALAENLRRTYVVPEPQPDPNPS